MLLTCDDQIVGWRVYRKVNQPETVFNVVRAYWNRSKPGEATMEIVPITLSGSDPTVVTLDLDNGSLDSLEIDNMSTPISIRQYLFQGFSLIDFNFKYEIYPTRLSAKK